MLSLLLSLFFKKKEPAPAPASLLVSGGAALPAVRTPGLQPASQPAQAVAQT